MSLLVWSGRAKAEQMLIAVEVVLLWRKTAMDGRFDIQARSRDQGSRDDVGGGA
jgi:hypothetical protein